MSFSINFNCDECHKTEGMIRQADNGDIVIECLSCGEPTLAVIRARGGAPVERREQIAAPITSDYVEISGMGNLSTSKTISAHENIGRYMELNTVNQGVFRFMFKLNPDPDPKTKYYMEVLWNPERYGIVDFLVGMDIDDIDAEMQSIKRDISYYANGARIACEGHVEEDTDPDGVYKTILDSWDNHL